jgi:hypothetical protein
MCVYPQATEKISDYHHHYHHRQSFPKHPRIAAEGFALWNMAPRYLVLCPDVSGHHNGLFFKHPMSNSSQDTRR